MFATLTYNKVDVHAYDEVTVAPGSTRCFGGRKHARLACTLCRAKKVKCSGEDGGCTRCKSKRIKCVYPASNARGSYAKSIAGNSRRGPEREDTDSKPTECNIVSSPTHIALKEHTRSLDFGMDFADMQMDDASFFDLNKDLLPMNSFDMANDFDYAIYPEPNELDRTDITTSSIPQSPSPSPSESHSHLQPCSCSQSAVQMLEELESKEYNTTTLSTDVVLNHQKLSLFQIYPWLTCSCCPTPRATSMLLALIIERLSVHLEKGVDHFIHELREPQDSTATTITKKHHTRLGSVGKFQIESRQEWCQIMRVLLVTKCQELVCAVEELEKRDIMMLSDTRRRMKRSLNELMNLDPNT